MKPIFIALALILAGLTAMSLSVQAAGVDRRPAGHFGLIAGLPTGLTADVPIDRSNRLFGDLGVSSDDLALQGGWLHEFPGIVKPRDSRLTLKSFLGAAALFRQQDMLSLGLAIEQELAREGSPFFLLARFIPAVRLSPSAGFEMSAVIGATFAF
ncbi:MAG: hypothetical protein HY547_07955 [Elusimicrobia bacterium]|nr:hypothetical protein [Elusimicrobiota bacterium]